MFKVIVEFDDGTIYMGIKSEIKIAETILKLDENFLELSYIKTIMVDDRTMYKKKKTVGDSQENFS